MTAKVDKKLCMVLFKGHPGSGKSSLSRCLARKLQWPVIDKDDAKDVLMTSPSSLEESDANALSYSIMLCTAETQLSSGMSVLVDCPLARIQLYQQAVDIASKHKALVVVVECICKTQAVWKARLAARAESQGGNITAHKPQKWMDVEAIIERYGGCDAWTTDLGSDLKLLVVDTSQCLPEQGCTTVLRFLADAGLLPERKPLPLDDPLFLMSG